MRTAPVTVSIAWRTRPPRGASGLATTTTYRDSHTSPMSERTETERSQRQERSTGRRDELGQEADEEDRDLGIAEVAESSPWRYPRLGVSRVAVPRRRAACARARERPDDRLQAEVDEVPGSCEPEDAKDRLGSAEERGQADARGECPDGDPADDPDGGAEAGATPACERVPDDQRRVRPRRADHDDRDEYERPEILDHREASPRDVSLTPHDGRPLGRCPGGVQARASSLLAVVVVWAGSFSVIKQLLDDGVAAGDIAILRYAIAAPGFAYILWRARGLPGLTRARCRSASRPRGCSSSSATTCS